MMKKLLLTLAILISSLVNSLTISLMILSFLSHFLLLKQTQLLISVMMLVPCSDCEPWHCEESRPLPANLALEVNVLRVVCPFSHELWIYSAALFRFRRVIPPGGVAQSLLVILCFFFRHCPCLHFNPLILLCCQ